MAIHLSRCLHSIIPYQGVGDAGRYVGDEDKDVYIEI